MVEACVLASGARQNGFPIIYLKLVFFYISCVVVFLTNKFHLGQLVYTPIFVLLELPGFHLLFFIGDGSGNTRARSMEISLTHLYNVT